MASLKLSVRSSDDNKAELLRLIESFAAANDSGDRSSALRLIDRAWRIAAHNPEINYLYAQLRLADGDAAGAVGLFATAANAQVRPEYEAAYILALCSNGQPALAQDRMHAALNRFAVAAGDPLATAARAVIGATSPLYPGWIGIGPDMVLRGEAIGKVGNLMLEISTPSQSILRSIPATRRRDFAPFDLPVPQDIHGELNIRLDGSAPLGGSLSFPPDFGLDGHVALSDSALTGWVTLRWIPDRPLTMTFAGENGVLHEQATTPDPLNPGRQLFSIDRHTSSGFGASVAIHVSMPNGRLERHPSSPFVIRPRLAPPNPPPRRSEFSAEKSAGEKTDILIVVRRGFGEPLTAIRAAAETAGADAEVVVIDDASREFGPALDALAAAGTITLLRNARDLGFSQSINRGLGLHQDRDLVILSADALVFDGWLARLRSAAYAGPLNGTATPLTNSSAIMCYPASGHYAPTRDEAIEWDRLAAASRNNPTIDLPFGNDTCLYIRRDCLDSVGAFDAETFPDGYGEDTDFCRRASNSGWRHVLAGNIYVRHRQERALRARAAAQFARNRRLLDFRYPGHEGEVEAYKTGSSLHIIRRKLDEARLLAVAQPYVLFVSHILGGGVARAINDRIARIRDEGFKPITLKRDPKFQERCGLDLGQPGFDDLYYNVGSELPDLLSFLAKLTIDHVELHHFIDLPGAVIDGLFALPFPTDIKVHDYVWYCPRVNLLNGHDRYCGEPDIAACQSCIDENGSYLTEKLSVSALLNRSARWLGDARTVTVPTEGGALRMRAKFPDISIQVEPLETGIQAKRALKAAGRPIKIAILGAVGENKGLSILLAMARHAANLDLPLEFVVIGFAEDDRPLLDIGNIFVTGEYEEFEIAGLIAREKPDIALFLSQFPETWCYTLTHALRANLPVAAFDFGAIAERLRALPAEATILFPLSTTPAEICDRVLSAFGEAKPQRTPIALALDHGGAILPQHDEDVMNAHKSPETATVSRIAMAKNLDSLSAAVEFLPLPSGLYVFSVRSSARAQRVGAQGEIALPALQIGTGPGAAADQIEFMTGPLTHSAWLCEPHDQIVLKVKVQSATLLLTSIVAPGMTPLEIGIQRLDRAADEIGETSAERPSVPAPLPLQSTQKSIRLKVTPHIRNTGDMAFADSQWAGLIEEQLWIESFTILPLEELSPETIEYKGVTSTGVETPWVNGGGLCGTRGIMVPLVGFAVRIKPQSGGPAFSCEYGAVLLSGTVIGPMGDGAMCQSADTSDPIGAIWVSIGRSDLADSRYSNDAPSFESGISVDAKSISGSAAELANDAATPKRRKSPIGPRFSVFREAPEADQE